MRHPSERVDLTGSRRVGAGDAVEDHRVLEVVKTRDCHPVAVGVSAAKFHVAKATVDHGSARWPVRETWGSACATDKRSRTP